MIPGPGWLVALWARLRASAPLRWALIALGVIAGLLGWRAIERRDAAGDRERSLRRRSAEQALERERMRQDVEMDAARGSARGRLLEHWRRPGD